MSGGQSDVLREEEAGRRVEEVARQLAKVLREVTDPVFGILPGDAVDIVNTELRKAHINARLKRV